MNQKMFTEFLPRNWGKTDEFARFQTLGREDFYRVFQADFPLHKQRDTR